MQSTEKRPRAYYSTIADYCGGDDSAAVDGGGGGYGPMSTFPSYFVVRPGNGKEIIWNKTLAIKFTFQDQIAMIDEKVVLINFTIVQEGFHIEFNSSQTQRLHLLRK